MRNDDKNQQVGGKQDEKGKKPRGRGRPENGKHLEKKRRSNTYNGSPG